MNKIKIVFNQTLMIVSAIVFGIGVQMAVLHVTGEFEEMHWPWYIPLSIVLTGFLCAVPTSIFLKEGLSGKAMWARNVFHFLYVGAVVGVCGYLFGWYRSFREALPIFVMYVLIYAFVWIVTIWFAKTDEKKINDAIREFQDEE